MDWGSTWDFLWHFLIIFAWIAYLLVLFQILTDLFWRDHKTSGVVKAIWVIFLFLIPWLTALVYLIARGQGMSVRAREAAVAAKQQTDDYIRQAAGRSPAEEIAHAKELLDAGTITQAEYDSLKPRRSPSHVFARDPQLRARCSATVTVAVPVWAARVAARLAAWRSTASTLPSWKNAAERRRSDQPIGVRRGGPTRCMVDSHRSFVQRAMQVAEVDQQRAGRGHAPGSHEPSGPQDLQAWHLVGPQDGDDAVVGVRAHAQLARLDLDARGDVVVVHPQHVDRVVGERVEVVRPCTGRARRRRSTSSCGRPTGAAVEPRLDTA